MPLHNLQGSMTTTWSSHHLCLAAKDLIFPILPARLPLLHKKICVWPSQHSYSIFSFLNNFSKMPSIRNWSTLVYDLAMISNMCVLANHWHWECNDRWQTTEVTHIAASMMKLDTGHSNMSARLVLHVDVGKRMLLLRPNFHPGAMKVVKKTGALLFCLPLLLRP